MSTQLQIFKIKCIDNNEKTVPAVIDYTKNNIGGLTDFCSEIVVLLKFYLALPGIYAVSELSAFSLRCIKNWWRSAMSL